MKLRILHDLEHRPRDLQLLQDAWQRAGHQVQLIASTDLQQHQPEDSPAQYRLYPTAHRSTPGLIDWLRRCPAVSDPLPAILAGRDKRIGQRLLDAAGLQTPPWREVDSHRGPVIGRAPWICKPAQGGQGRDIILARSLEEAEAHQAQIGRPCLIQHFIPQARSYRVLCTPRRVLAVYERGSVPGSLVAAVSRGDRRLPVQGALRDRLSLLGLQMVGAMSGHVMGADILIGRDGRLWPLEVNTNPGLDFDSSTLVDDFVTAAAQGLSSIL